MQTPNLFDAALHTIGQTIGSSEAMTLILLIAGVIAFFILRHQLHERPRLDVTRHLERPPIEHPPLRALPPAREDMEWAKEKDTAKENVPWR